VDALAVDPRAVVSIETSSKSLSKRPVIRLKPREGRRVKSGAPWAFSNELALDASVKTLPPGTLVELAAEDGTPIGAGYFNAKSLIAVRLLGKPETKFDVAFFADRLRRARGLREAFFTEPYYRLVHAEGDRLPGVVVDRFGDTVVIQITTAGMEHLTDAFLSALDEVIAPACVILRNDTPARALEALESYVRVAKGVAPSQLTVQENGARYLADPHAGQKSGWYYDQRDNRRFIAGLARGKRVLDAYCYSGGFAVLAAVEGAALVTGLDSSAPALDLARAAATVNNVDALCTFRKAEIFAELERLGHTSERFDIVIADPPPFAPSRKDVETGARAYRKLARLAASLVAPGGYLMLASCSHNMPAERFTLECAAGIARAGRSARLIRQAGAGPDHPVHPMLPETAYLKALAYAVD
jgi:23S rRNA (cytosine1962-C5)-methyltransferase